LIAENASFLANSAVLAKVNFECKFPGLIIIIHCGLFAELFSTGVSDLDVSQDCAAPAPCSP